MNVQIEDSWRVALREELHKPYYSRLLRSIEHEYTSHTTYPASEHIFSALNLCPLTRVKVVILGQDPYHGAGQAMGLAFSVPEGVRIPPSLLNIYKEIKADIGIPIRSSGDLTQWTDQGVLLLNATLTVRASEAGAHQGLGWERFTDAVIEKISEQREHVVFLLWGNYARSKTSLIDSDKHLVLEAPHPSPLSANRGFLGCKHFSKTNSYLQSHQLEPIKW